MFTHLHVHTEYSLLDGMCRIPILMNKAKHLGMTSLAVTDHGCLYGILEFYRQAREAGIKPILGCEVYVAPKDMRSKTPSEKSSYHLVLLAKNKTGYYNLLKLATAAQLEGFYYKPRVDWELISNHHAGLVALSACPQGELGQLILEGRLPEAEAAAIRHKEVFGDYYLELQQHDIPELAQINRELVSLSRKLRLPLVATNDVHYVNKTDAYAHDLLLCIQTNNTIQNEKRPRMTGDSFYLKSQAEMAELFPELPEALTVTEQIAEMCSLELDFGRLHLPEIDLPPGKTAFDQLSDLAYQGLARRYHEAPQEALDRLRYELEVIRQTEFANYFLVIWDVISFVRERSILFGVRGSAAASIVLYSLGITDLDPLTHGLVFERFLNIERKEMPDIDLDFQDDRRDEVIAYVASRYGPDRVAQIITFGTMGARAAIRDVGRALGMPYADVDSVARLIPPLAPTIAEALEANNELRHVYQEDNTVRHLIDTAGKLEGVARHASTHAAGIVISRDPLTEHVALQRPTRHEEQGISMTQFAMEDIARIGLLKMDFLGLANLTILERAARNIAAHRQQTLDLHRIPLDDSQTFELLSSGETTGVFQLEGGQMRRFIRELKPTCFADIAAMVALYRPGPKQHIPTFIDAKHGREPIRFPHPALAEILKETYGVIVYQDQVLLIVQAFAGYTLGEADIVRKAMGKKIPEVMKKEKARFVAGAKGKGFSDEVAQQVWALIEPFAGYAFNKAHSVSYALIAYQTAYLKANYPVEFMCALLSINAGNSDKIAQAVSECHRLGIKVLSPDINRSCDDFTIEETTESGPAIRFGLDAIKNVSAPAVRALVAEREGSGPFASIDEFCRRANLRNLNKRTLESMVKAGALDAFGTRSALLASLDRIISLSQTEQRLKEIGQSTMFDLWGQTVDTPLPSISLPELETSINEKVAWEKELLGICLSDHPFMRVSREVASNIDTFCGQISEEMVGHVVTTAGIVVAPRYLTTRDKRPFVTASLEDFGGSIEVTAWPEVFQRTKDLWRDGNTLVIKGKVKAGRDGLQLSCISASLYTPVDSHSGTESARQQQEPPQPRRRIMITLVTSDNRDADVAQLHQVFNAVKHYRGADKVYLSVITNGGATQFELPAQTSYCTDLHRSLVTIVGEANVIVEDFQAC
ncbi:MAG: DNA polymerase III subunit alpha [Dehalococcoidia bacterium]|nr:DNA polymerase III subunit alpha [Dehalococcoidia bacterium]